MFFLKKNYICIIILFILLILLVYAANITSIPDSLILFQNEELKLKTIAGINVEKTVETGATLKENNYIKDNSSGKKQNYNITLLGFNIKTITANVIPNTKVIPLGNIAGLKLYTKGVLVVGVSQIQGEDKKTYKPYEDAGINQGDSILEINDQKVNNTKELLECVSKSKGRDIKITYVKDGNILTTNLTPVKTSKNTYKIGLWVRDAAAGVGTISFYDPSTNSFAALGHGIQDIDTQELVDISSGEFVTTDILNIDKGEENNPGKIEGTIEDSKTIGKIYSNTEYGVYGYATDKKELNLNGQVEVDVASRNEIRTGKASIICTLENNNRKEYEVEIEKVYVNNNENNKSMVVKVTDKELLEKTGGIIQGMSGSPILQNGKFIGCLTHVLVSNPTKGYGVFSDIMIKQLRNIN